MESRSMLFIIWTSTTIPGIHLPLLRSQYYAHSSLYRPAYSWAKATRIYRTATGTHKELMKHSTCARCPSKLNDGRLQLNGELKCLLLQTHSGSPSSRDSGSLWVLLQTLHIYSTIQIFVTHCKQLLYYLINNGYHHHLQNFTTATLKFILILFYKLSNSILLTFWFVPHSLFS